MTVSPSGSQPCRKYLKDQAYDQIKQEILSGQLTGGVLLSERTLAERLRLGKAPIRDAINRLRQEEYLSVSPQLGVMVKPLTLKDVADTFEARVIVEPEIVKRLAGHLSSEHRDILQANLDHQKSCISGGEAIEFVKWDVEFHMALARAHGNSDLVRMMDRICERTFQAISLAFDGSVTALMPAFKAHKSILSAILKGDARSAETRMNRHITRTRDLKGASHSSVVEPLRRPKSVQD